MSAMLAVLIYALISNLCIVRAIHEAQQIVSSTLQKKNTIYHANDTALNFLETTPTPYKIISVIGQARKGKSTTLNSIISKLTKQNVSPFKTSGDIDACTHGIWMYIVPKCTAKCTVNEDREKCLDTKKDVPCVNSDYSFIFLDIEGSDTSANDMALRYASIVTLLSSKIFLFIHQSLYMHDIAYINDLETFRKAMNDQNIQMAFNELDLSIIIREPLGTLVKGKLEEKINGVFQEFSGITISEDSSLLTHTLPVLAIDNLDNNRNYQQSIQSIADFIADTSNYVQARNKVIFDKLRAEKIIEFIHTLIKAMNEDEDLKAICVGCIFTKIIEWNNFGEWSECNQECGTGIMERRRTCNSGRNSDCMKYRHGSASDQRQCNEFPCPVEWDEWHRWSQCDRDCDGGMQERFRKCKTGQSIHCEKKFGNKETERRDCNTHSCYNVFCTKLGLFC